MNELITTMNIKNDHVKNLETNREFVYRICCLCYTHTIVFMKGYRKMTTHNIVKLLIYKDTYDQLQVFCMFCESKIVFMQNFMLNISSITLSVTVTYNMAGRLC